MIHLKSLLLNVVAHCLPLGCATVLTLGSVPGACAQSSDPAPLLKAPAEEGSDDEGDRARAFSNQVNDLIGPP